MQSVRFVHSVVLAGCEDVADEGLLHLAHLHRLTALNLSNCCKARSWRILRAVLSNRPDHLVFGGCTLLCVCLRHSSAKT